MFNTVNKLLTLFISSLIFANVVQAVEVKPEIIEKNKTIGILKSNDPKLEGVTWSNWGSRPYEYKWASSVVDVEGKRVIDLGMGLPRQTNWYCYVVDHLKTKFYAGIDNNKEILNQGGGDHRFEAIYMDMRSLKYPEKSYDVAYSIGTFSTMNANDLMKAISEVHRVLKDDGLLIVTLEERWDKNVAYNSTNNWNTLEQTLKSRGMVDDSEVAFGMPPFLELIKDYFVPYVDGLEITTPSTIYSTTQNANLYVKNNRDTTYLNGGDTYNSNVSYVILKKATPEE